MSPINQRPSIVDKPRPRLALAPFLTTLAMAATSLWLCFVLPTTLGKAVALLVTIPLAYLVFATSEPIWAVRIEITGNEFSYYSKFPRTWPRVDEGRPGTVNLE